MWGSRGKENEKKKGQKKKKKGPAATAGVFLPFFLSSLFWFDGKVNFHYQRNPIQIRKEGIFAFTVTRLAFFALLDDDAREDVGGEESAGGVSAGGLGQTGGRGCVPVLWERTAL